MPGSGRTISNPILHGGEGWWVGRSFSEIYNSFGLSRSCKEVAKLKIIFNQGQVRCLEVANIFNPILGGVRINFDILVNTISQEDNLTGRHPHRKTTSKKEDLT